VRITRRLLWRHATVTVLVLALLSALAATGGHPIYAGLAVAFGILTITFGRRAFR
jgi:hypothetical protein